MNRIPPLAPLGRALLDHHRGVADAVLRVRFDDGQVDEVRAASFFRDVRDFESVDRAVLDRVLARTAPGGPSEGGRILDVGAGAGPLAVALVRNGREVTALESLPEAVTILRERGVGDVRAEDLWTFEPEAPYAVVLAVLNGPGLAGTLGRLPALLERLAGFLAPDGVVLLDSSDLRPEGEPDVLDDGRYVGELQLQLEYDGLRGEPFPHLFVDPDRLGAAAADVELTCEVVARQADGRYLAAVARP